MITRLVLTNARVLLNESGAGTCVQGSRSAVINRISGSDCALDSSFALSTNQNLWSMHPIIATLVSMVTAAPVQ